MNLTVLGSSGITTVQKTWNLRSDSLLRSKILYGRGLTKLIDDLFGIASLFINVPQLGNWGNLANLILQNQSVHCAVG